MVAPIAKQLSCPEVALARFDCVLIAVLNIVQLNYSSSIMDLPELTLELSGPLSSHPKEPYKTILNPGARARNKRSPLASDREGYQDFAPAAKVSYYGSHCSEALFVESLV